MKSKLRVLWMKIHTYFSCFFFPIALVYVATGVLYLFEIEGGEDKEYEYSVALPAGWPESEEQAKQLILPFMMNNDHGKFPTDYYQEPDYISWYGFKQEILFIPTDDVQRGKLMVKKHDLLNQLLLIHVGYAGPVFWFFAIMLSLSLVVNIVSGLVLAFTLPSFKTAAINFSLLGFITLCICFFLGY